VKSQKGLGSKGKATQIFGHGGEEVEGGDRREPGLIDLEEVGNFLTHLVGCIVKVDIVNQNFIYFGTGRGREGDQPAVGEMAAAPEIDRSRISVVDDVHVKLYADGGEREVVLSGIFEKGGPDGQKGDVEGPNIF
jgi:hypothetical protein